MPRAVDEPLQSSPPASLPPAAAQVRERHLRALYINVPIEPDAMQALLLPPAVPHIHGGKAWLSIVLDDLFTLESPFGPCCFLPVPGMNGWMMKVNALMACPPRPGAEPLCGYQILTLDFQQTRGPSSWVKTKGAQATQMVPTRRAHFDMSAGATGYTESSSMATGTMCSAVLKSADAGSELLVKLKGTLVPLDDESRALCEFVVGHPTKFLAQQGSARCGCCPPRLATSVLSGRDNSGTCQQLAYASWRAGYDCSAEGCMRVEISEVVLPVLQRLEAALPQGALPQHDDSERLRSAVVCFLQPEYSMVDCKNTLIESGAAFVADVGGLHPKRD